MPTSTTLSTRTAASAPLRKPPVTEHLLNMTPLQRVESAARRLRSAEAQVADRRLALDHEIQFAIGIAVSRLRPSESHPTGRPKRRGLTARTLTLDHPCVESSPTSTTDNDWRH